MAERDSTTRGPTRSRPPRAPAVPEGGPRHAGTSLRSFAPTLKRTMRGGFSSRGSCTGTQWPALPSGACTQ